MSSASAASPPSTPGRGKTATEIDQEHREWAMSNPARGGCLFCLKFRPKGTGAEVRALNEAHIQEHHPELLKKRRRRRARGTGVIAFRQSLTDDESREIDAARERRMKLLGIES